MKEQRYYYRFYVMCALSLVLIFLVGTFRPQPMSSVIDKERFWAEKVHANTRYNVIIAGDSRAYRGIAPAALSDALDGLKVLNYGFSSGGFNNVIFREIDRRLTEENAIVLLGITPFSLTPDAQKNEHYAQEKERDGKEVFRRRFISPVIHFFDPIKPSDILYKMDKQKGYYERFKKDGWVASKKIPVDTSAALKSYKRNFKDNTVDTKVLNELYAAVRRWKKRGIKIYAFRLPTTKSMALLENQISGFNETEIKRSLTESGANWIEIEDKYEYSSYDGSHLDETAAMRFSNYLGKELKKNL